MLNDTKYITDSNIELAVFPTNVLLIRQGMGGYHSHRKSFSIDIVGANEEDLLAFAPFNCTIKWIGTDIKNRVLFESDNMVLLANGEVDYINFMLSNTDDISSYTLGASYVQGERIYKAGKAGYSVKSHIDLKVAKGKFNGGTPLEVAYITPAHCMYPNVKHFKIRNQIEVYNVFWINDTEIINGFKYLWKVYEK